MDDVVVGTSQNAVVAGARGISAGYDAVARIERIVAVAEIDVTIDAAGIGQCVAAIVKIDIAIEAARIEDELTPG